jgi:hypothetical protein
VGVPSAAPVPGPPPRRRIAPVTVAWTDPLRRIVRADAPWPGDGFREAGPWHRFDHHDAADPRPRGVLYAAPALGVCVAEVFEAPGAIERPGDWRLVRLEVARPLELLDLRGPAAMRAGTVDAIGGGAPRPVSQAWARFIYDHPDRYGQVDGLLYRSRTLGGDAVCLWERARDAIGADAAWRLTDPAVFGSVLVAAERCGLAVGPTGA